MSTRKAHNKTRLGCGQCKKRRVKCDGKQPTCANCEKRGLECSFLLLVPSSRLASTAPSTPSTTPIKKTPYDVQIFRRSPSVSVSVNTSPQNIIEDGIISGTLPLLRDTLVIDVWDDFRHKLDPRHQILLDHYERETCLTLATDGPAKSAWKFSVPGMASEHKYLVHGVLSVASLHLSRLYDGKEERDAMNRIAVEQMNRALSHFRVELDNITESNAAALFAHSTLTAVYFFRTSTLDMEEIRAAIPAGVLDPAKLIVDKMIQSFIRILWGLRGALTVLKPGWNWVIEGNLASLCLRKWWPKHRLPHTPRAKEEDKRLAELEQLWMHAGQADANQAECLSNALKYLRQTFALVSLLTDPNNDFPPNAPIPYAVDNDNTTVGLLRDRAAIFVWATQLSKDFISLVEQKNHYALVLMAYYAVLLGRVRNVWWLDGVGINMIMAVAMALGRKKWELIAWPTQAVGVDLNDGFGVEPLNHGLVDTLHDLQAGTVWLG